MLTWKKTSACTWVASSDPFQITITKLKNELGRSRHKISFFSVDMVDTVPLEEMLVYDSSLETCMTTATLAFLQFKEKIKEAQRGSEPKQEAPPQEYILSASNKELVNDYLDAMLELDIAMLGMNHFFKKAGVFQFSNWTDIVKKVEEFKKSVKIDQRL